MSDYWTAYLIVMGVFNLMGGCLIWYLKRDQKRRQRPHGQE